VISDGVFGPAFYVAGITPSSSSFSTIQPAYTFKTAIYNATSPVPFNISFEGIKTGDKATLVVLTAPDGLSSNALVNGTVVEVVQRDVSDIMAGEQGTFEFELENYSLAVLTT
jgi:alpha-N-arabinofuranosidase